MSMQRKGPRSHRRERKERRRRKREEQRRKKMTETGGENIRPTDPTSSPGSSTGNMRRGMPHYLGPGRCNLGRYGNVRIKKNLKGRDPYFSFNGKDKKHIFGFLKETNINFVGGINVYADVELIERIDKGVKQVIYHGRANSIEYVDTIKRF